MIVYIAVEIFMMGQFWGQYAIIKRLKRYRRWADGLLLCKL